MKKKLTKLKIDTVLFKEEGQYHIYSPQLHIHFNAPKKDQAISCLTEASELQLAFWEKSGGLKARIEKLGLGRISKEKRRTLNHDITVPYSFFRRKNCIFGKISLTMNL